MAFLRDKPSRDIDMSRLAYGMSMACDGQQTPKCSEAELRLLLESEAFLSEKEFVRRTHFMNYEEIKERVQNEFKDNLGEGREY